ncbi:MAG TPA: beta-galactosidase [Bacteroidales bacterium]|nr:beta-galactosidase [Bacteroidales bacterium]
MIMKFRQFILLMPCLLLVFLTSIFSVKAQDTQLKYLSGTGNDNTVAWEFYCSEGMNSGKWTTIPVPSQWELQGFGSYTYGIDPWEERMNEHGIYRHEFSIPGSWKGKKVNIVFEGVMTDAEVKINGKTAGPVHQGAFYEFKYDVSKFLNYGNKANSLVVTVRKHSSDSLVNEAERWSDYWVLGGIFRPVYLEVKPDDHIERLAIDAQANGDFRADVFFSSSAAKYISVELQNLNGSKIADFENAIKDNNGGVVQVSDHFDNIQSWNPEFPKLYQLLFKLQDNNHNVLHQEIVRTGFRTVEVKEKDGIYINGVKVKRKGISRHTFWPSSGRTTNKNISITDVNLMKEMNMNAVRMSHYPPDKHFLDACDSLGLFVLNELGGWGPPPYGTEIGRKLVKELVLRDVNHPSIILWDNGNEGGWNPNLDDEFLLWDPQQREVIRPRQIFRKLNTLHYFKYNYLAYDSYQQDRIFLTTEFLHGCWDEGHGAGLDDYWRLMWDNPVCAGGFLWNLSDEAVVRTDRNNILDVDGNHAADGITGPAREKEGSFYAVKEIWAPVYIEKKYITPAFDGKFKIENRYHYINLEQCEFEAKWIKFRGPNDSETTPLLVKKTGIPGVYLEPGNKGVLSVEMPDDWNSFDALYIKALDPHKNEIFTWSFPLKDPGSMKYENLETASADQAPEADETAQSILVHARQISFEFDKKTGTLVRTFSEGKEIVLHNGPRFITGQEMELSGIKHYPDEQGNYVVEFSFQGDINKFRNIQYSIKWAVRPDGLLDLTASGHYMQGITFDYPEEQIRSVKRLGDGPFRVWRNRMKGTRLAVWEDDYNNTITGDPSTMYDYPEFKGFFSSLYWARFFNNDNSNLTVYCHTPYTFFRLFTPETPEAVREGWGTDKLEYPEGDISFLNAIPPIGTMFKRSEDLGPQSQPETVYGWDSEPVVIKLTFDFKTR